MRIILIALFSFVTLVLIGQDQTVTCDPVCGGPITFSAACADDQGGGAADYTYTTTIGSVSAAGIVTIAQADIDALPTGTTQIIVDVTCTCIDIGCMYTTEYIFPIEEVNEFACFINVNGLWENTQQVCEWTVCLGDTIILAFRDDPNTVGLNNTTVTAPDGTVYNSGITSSIIVDSTSGGTWTWEYTSPDGCTADGTFELLIKIITQESICPN